MNHITIFQHKVMREGVVITMRASRHFSKPLLASVNKVKNISSLKEPDLDGMMQ